MLTSPGSRSSPLPLHQRMNRYIRRSVKQDRVSQLPVQFFRKASPRRSDHGFIEIIRLPVPGEGGWSVLSQLDGEWLFHQPFVHPPDLESDPPGGDGFSSDTRGVCHSCQDDRFRNLSPVMAGPAAGMTGMAAGFVSAIFR